MKQFYLYWNKGLLLFLLVLGFNFAMAQERTVSGKVTSEVDGSPLPGVNVIIKGTSQGTVTDVDGTFTLSADENDVLIFSFIGYGNKEVPVSSITGNSVTVALSENVQSLSEVVVIGYGTQEKRDATGAVASIKAEDFNMGVITSPEQLIQGKTAGVQITQASGEPGAGINIRIRGTSSVRAGNNPLFVVDGIPLGGGDISSGGQNIGRGTSSARNPLNFLNPNDIASIDILKDASATAIYGSRGANGVVLITTKSGRGKRNKVTYATSVSVSSPANKYDLLNRQQFLSNAGRLGADVDALDYGADTDWQDEVLRTSVSHKHDLSYANAYKTGDYRISLGYQNQEGIVKNTALERMTARLNFNQSLIKEKLNLGVNATISRINDEQAAITDNAGFEGDLIGVMYMANPTWPGYADSQFDNNIANPLAMLKYYQDLSETDRQLVNVSLDYDIIEGLNFKVNGGFDNSSSTREAVYSPDLYLGSGIYGNGRGFIGELETNSNLLEAFFNYNTDFGNSTLTALAGYSYQEFNKEGINILGWGFSNPNMSVMRDNLSASAATIRNAIDISYQQFGYDANGLFVNSLFPEVTTTHLTEVPNASVKSVTGDRFEERDELQSFFGRVNYSLLDKYLFTATFRADGSTKFGENNRYGYFPSGAFAWRLSEEQFIPDFFNDLKFRLGYGVTGNQEIPHNLYQERQRYDGISIGDGGEISIPGIGYVATKNPDLKWEQTTQVNLGLDFEILEGVLSGSVDLYKKVTTDLLMKIVTAQPAAKEFYFDNLDADVVNQGVEAILNINAITTDAVDLMFSINAAYNKNEVEDFDKIIDTGQINGQGLTGAFSQRIVGGQPLYAYFLRDFLGFDERGLAIYHVDKQEFIGKSPLPKYNVGFNTNFRYKQWDLSAYFYGQFGHYIYNNTANAFFTLGSLKNGRNITEDALYTGESAANAPDASTRFLEKGDFFRMQNLNIGYNAPVSEGFIKGLRIYASAQNLFVITKYSGLDPEVNVNKALNDVPSLGIDYTAYPRARTYTIGLNVSF